MFLKSAQISAFFCLISMLCSVMAIFDYTSIINVIIAHLLLCISMLFTLVSGFE